MPNALAPRVLKYDMRTGPATAGWLILAAALTGSAAAHAHHTVWTPMLGWSPSARLPRSLSEAEQLAAQAREPAPISPLAPTEAQSRAFTLRFWQWFERVTDAATRASAWYLTEVLGPEPFREQVSELWFLDAPLPNLGPSTAAYVILGTTMEDQWNPLAHAIAAPPARASTEHFIETLADVGFLFFDIGSSAWSNSAGPNATEYVDAVEMTKPLAIVLLRQCRRVSTALQTWTPASRRCEEWLGAHWRAELELASLDELLPIADRVPLTRFGFAPVGLPARP